MDKEEKKRTRQQNKALHKMFSLLSDELNAQGLDMRKTLKPSIDIWWNTENLKEYLWRPIQRATVVKESTTELTTKDIDRVFEVLMKHLGEKFGVHIPFPSVEEVMREEWYGK